MIPVIVTMVIGIPPTSVITRIIVTSPTSVIPAIVTAIISIIPGISITPTVVISIGTTIPTVSPIPAIVAVRSPEIIIPERICPGWCYPGIGTVNVYIPVIVIQKINISILRV